MELEGGAGGGTVAGGPGPRGRTPRSLLQPVQGPRAAGPRGYPGIRMKHGGLLARSG